MPPAPELPPPPRHQGFSPGYRQQTQSSVPTRDAPSPPRDQGFSPGYHQQTQSSVPTRDAPPSPRHQGSSPGYHQQTQSSVSTRDAPPQTRLTPSGSPNPAPQRASWSDQPTTSDATTLRPRSLYPPLNHSQSRLSLQPEGRARSPSFLSSTGSPSSPARSDDPGDLVAICDGCGRDLGTAEHRVQCTVCHDYDLCAGCFQNGKVSKSHNSSHKVSHVLNTLLLKPDDLVPAREGVNPPTDPANGDRENWSLVQHMPNTPGNPTNLTTTMRKLHLFSDDSHARFRAYAPPGHYGISIQISVNFDPGLAMNVAAHEQLLLRPGGAGKFRMTLGVVADKEVFAGTRFPEDSFSDETLTPTSLPNKLFQPGHRGVVGSLGLVADMYNTESTIRPDFLLHVKGSGDSGAGRQIGLILQWSGVASWQQATKPVVSITVLNVTYAPSSPYPCPIYATRPLTTNVKHVQRARLQRTLHSRAVARYCDGVGMA